MSAWNDRNDLLDEPDQQMLTEIRGLYQQLDPLPPNLVANVTALIDGLDDLDDRLAALEPELAGAVRGSRASDPTRLARAGLEIWITVTGDDQFVVIDGWHFSAGTHVVELVTGDQQRTTTTDETGHFSFDEVPRGPIELVVAVPRRDDTAPPEEVRFRHDLRE
jgi:hypothetical protein